jgi:hypothetical protein
MLRESLSLFRNTSELFLPIRYPAEIAAKRKNGHNTFLSLMGLKVKKSEDELFYLNTELH